MKRTIFVTLLSLSACATTGDADGADDAFLSGGKSDSGISEGSPDAVGVLRVANELTRDQLDNDVGLASTAANAIDAYRRGADGTAATSDDRSFATLAQLDAVKYVGPVAFQHLLVYARAHGYVATGSGSGSGSGVWPADYWTVDTSCESMSFDQLVSGYFSPGVVDADFGGVTFRGRTRDACNTYTGCTPWLEPSTVSLEQPRAEGQLPAGSMHTVPSTGEVSLHLDTAGSASVNIYFSNLEPAAPQYQIKFFSDWDHGSPDANSGFLNGGFEVVFVEQPFGDSSMPMYPSVTVEFAGDADNRSMLEMSGRICADGNYHLVSKLAADLGVTVGGGNDLNQIAIYGKL
jgi:hypothetical protein